MIDLRQSAALAIILQTVGLLCSIANAADLGTWGRIYDIEEPDIREVLIRQADAVDWKAKQRELKESANRYFNELPSYHLPLAEKTETTWVDPTVVLEKDIYAPIEKEDGTYEMQLLYPAGTRVNPLDHVRPVTNMLFINGKDLDQLALAKQAIDGFPERVIVVLTQGNPKDLAKEWNNPVYYANRSLLNRFRIKKVPTLLGVGEGDNARMLAVTTIGKPYSADTLISVWHGVTVK